MERRLDEGRPSLTAARVAARRASHQLHDRPLVFEDPLAVAVIGEEAAARIQDPAREHGRFSRAMRAFLVARSRYAEDRLAEAYGRGVRQYVVLGAGLDPFACRNPHPELRVFEVDHPATQAWKRRRLKAAGVTIPGSLVFAPVDFETQGLAEGLAAAGFDPARPAFVSWLGVVMYLTDEAAFQTLGYVAGLRPGSEIVFDFPVPLSALDPIRRFLFGRLLRRLDAIGEPFRSFFDPADLRRRLLALGFTDVETLGADEVNRLYFAGRKDRLRLLGPGRLARARV